MSNRSFAGLNGLNFFTAAMQTGFGAFLSVFLTAHHWNKADIGFALSVGTIVAMVAQVPAGALVDAVPSKRTAAGAAVLAIACCAVSIALLPGFVAVVAAETVHGIASCVLTPCIAALTLALSRLEALGERLGNNVRFGAIGSGFAAAVMGAAGYYVSHSFVFFLAAACGVAAALSVTVIRGADLAAVHERTDHMAAYPPKRLPAQPARPHHVAMDHRLIVFAAALVLFSLGNAAVLPIAAAALTSAGDHAAEPAVAAAIVVPQLIAAALSPAFGRAAQSRGRRPVLLLGFAALPLRACLFALGGGPVLLVAYQALDGISSAVIGMMLPLVVADLTRQSGRFNLAMGVLGLAIGVGATFSNGLAGVIADRFGNQAAFLALAAAGLAACLLAWAKLPETSQALREPIAGRKELHDA